jgi:Ni2+-binding GTPase involved in maturation of urease and hydrogenase
LTAIEVAANTFVPRLVGAAITKPDILIINKNRTCAALDVMERDAKHMCSDHPVIYAALKSEGGVAGVLGPFVMLGTLQFVPFD